jgi:hypothetical protein
MVKLAFCNISINPFEISTSYNLSSFLFTVSHISIDEIDSDDCKVESFTTIMGLLFLILYISELFLLLLLSLLSSFTA